MFIYQIGGVIIFINSFQVLQKLKVNIKEITEIVCMEGVNSRICIYIYIYIYIYI